MTSLLVVAARRFQFSRIGRNCLECALTPPALAGRLRAWRYQTPYAKEADFGFPSFRVRGRVPLSASIFVADHLRPAAKKAGVQIEDGQRFGSHNLRHSLSNWLVSKAKIEPKTVQGMPRHAKVQTTLDLYTREDGDEAFAAQGEYLTGLARGCYEHGAVRLWGGLWVEISPGCHQ